MTSLLLAYLLNSLWQTPLFFAGATLAAFALRRHNPRILHRLWVATLLLEAIFPALCLRSWPWLNTLARLVQPSHHGAFSTITFTFGPTSTLSQTLPSPLKSTLLLAYLLGTTYFALRLLWGIRKTAVLRQSASAPSTTPAIQAAWTRLTQHFAIRNAILAESSRIQTPLTFGLRQKYVLVPPNLLPTLDDLTLHALLAHECAHMQRDDFARNLLYELITLPIAFHPLFHATRARMVESREWICDEMATDALTRHTLGTRQLYARSLLQLATLLLQAKPATTSHAIGIFDTHTLNALERRLMHLTRKPLQLSRTNRLASMVASTLIAASTCGSAWAFRTSLLTAAPQSTPAAPGNVRIAAGVMAGQVTNRINPVYPPEAKAAGIEGAVVLHAIITRDGTVDSLSIISGPPELRQSAIEAVQQWTYKPYLLNGEPTPVETTITVNYQLNN